MMMSALYVFKHFRVVAGVYVRAWIIVKFSKSVFQRRRSPAARMTFNTIPLMGSLAALAQPGSLSFDIKIVKYR